MYLVLGGCTWSGGGGVPDPGGGVYLVLGGVPVPGGVPGRGVYLVPGGVPGQVLLPFPCGQTHACKNITFATSLRTVKIMT